MSDFRDDIDGTPRKHGGFGGGFCAESVSGEHRLEPSDGFRHGEIIDGGENGGLTDKFVGGSHRLGLIDILDGVVGDGFDTASALCESGVGLFERLSYEIVIERRFSITAPPQLRAFGDFLRGAGVLSRDAEQLSNLVIFERCRQIFECGVRRIEQRDNLLDARHGKFDLTKTLNEVTREICERIDEIPSEAPIHLMPE